jgi:hypothetical protein
MNEGQRWEKKLWSGLGRAQLERLPLSPWVSRRRKDLLELLDPLDPKIVELTESSRASGQEMASSTGLMFILARFTVFSLWALGRHNIIRRLLSLRRVAIMEHIHRGRWQYEKATIIPKELVRLNSSDNFFLSWYERECSIPARSE